MKKQIHFEWGSEKQIKVAQAGQKDTFFYEAYRQALAGVAEIVRASVIAVDGPENDPLASSECVDHGRECGPEFSDDKYFYNYPNNMIVFSGDRGAGKSSAMLSFVYSLKNPKSRLYDESFFKEMIARELPGGGYCSVSNILRNAQFIAIPPIDPTALENSDQILTVILARMFQLALDTWEEQESIPPRAPKQERLNQKNELMKQFSTCYQHICAIKSQGGSKDPEYEGLEVLADLRDNSRLKCELANLVKELLRFKCADSPKQSYLIIQIDDTDMNIQHAYAILEDIRKYLVIPRVIIVMAANLTHLKQVVESSLLDGYHAKLQKGPEYANHIAQQYITKLFPQTRQINLPELGTYFKEHADRIELYYHVMGQRILPDPEHPFYDVQEQIFRLIYKKTGLIFLKDKDRLHYIIPTNMRLHAHFLAMLIQMEDVVCPDEGTPRFFLEVPTDEKGLRSHRRTLLTRLDNILRFRDYFLSTWVTNNLNGEHAEVMGQLDHIDISRRVRFVCRYLWNKYVKTLPETDRKTHKLTEEQCNYANMILLCRYFETTSIEESNNRFIFAIHTYFSLLGHSIVLEDLIDFYDQLKAPGVSSLRCSLSRLYPLYGSRLFPYSDQLGEMEQSKYYTEVRIIDNADDSEHLYPLISCWESTAGGKLKDFRLKGTISLFYSMFANYYPVGDKSKLLLDLSSSIPNCLYMHKQEFLEMSPLAKTMWDDSASTNSHIIDDNGWITMRNSALLTVLNWDVQEKVGQNLLHSAKPEGMEKDGNLLSLKVSYDEWPGRVKAFYDRLSNPFHRKPDTTSFIVALDKIEFGGWFELPTLSDSEPIKEEEVLYIGEWYSALHKLNPYIECPEVKAPGNPADSQAGDQGTPQKPQSDPTTSIPEKSEQGAEEEVSPTPLEPKEEEKKATPTPEGPAENVKMIKGDVPKP